MITKENIESILESYPGGEDFFIVDVVVKKGNIVHTFVDRTGGITINECSTISRFIREKLDSAAEDVELMVSSPGLDQPLKIWQQYQKNTGRDLNIKLKDGKELRGTLVSLDQEQITLERTKSKKKQSPSGKKEPNTIIKIKFNQIESAKIVLTF